MKKLACLIISFLVIALSFTGTLFSSAFAAAETVYPADKFTETIVFSSLTDFAVGDGGYAFIDGGKLITIFGGEKKDDYGITPAGVDYNDGEFICSDSSGKVYSLPGLAESEKTVTGSSDTLTSESGSVYMLLNDGTIACYDAGTLSYVVCDCTFKIMKTYSGTIYAAGTDSSSACDRLYTISGVTAQPVSEELIYIDYTASQTISVGTAADKTNAYSVYNLNAGEIHFVTLIDGAYMTGIDLQSSLLSTSAYFTVLSDIGTFKVGDDGKPQGGDVALLLCVTGNASVVSIGENSYIMPTDGTTAYDVQAAAVPEATLKGTVVVTPCEVYSSPYPSADVQTDALDAGAEVTVTEIISLSGVLACDFYKINYENSDGQNASGYVPQSYFSTYTFIEEEPAEITDGETETGDYISSVLIVLIIVALVLIAICYLVYVSTSDKNKPSSDDEH